MGDAKSDEPLLELTASEQKLTHAAISSAVRGPCNGPNLEEFLLSKEMISNPQSLIVTEFRGAADHAYAPTPAWCKSRNGDWHRAAK